VTNHVSEIFAKVTIFEWTQWMGSAAALKQYDSLCNSENGKSQRREEIRRSNSASRTRM